MNTVDLNPLEVTDLQMKLRFATNTYIKSSNNPPMLTPLSSDEFNRVISEMRKTQDATLAQIRLYPCHSTKSLANLILVLTH